MSHPLVAAAEDYLDRGLRVIALTGKLPNGRWHPHWKDDCFAPDDRGTDLEAAFTDPDTTGIGILTGPPYYVVDIDGEEGATAWQALLGPGPAMHLPDRWVAKTGRGLHLWYASTEDFQTAKLGEKLDFKGNGGYVAAPPSLHPDGHTYEWLLAPDERYILEMPEALEKVLRRRKVEAEARMVDKQTMKVRRTDIRDRKPGFFYAGLTSYEGMIDRVRSEGEGNRNGVVYWAARTMLEEGAQPDDLEELLIAAQSSGLARREARRTIRSAIDALGE